MNNELLAVQRNNYLNLLKDVSEDKILEVQREFILKYTCDAVGMEGINHIPLEEVKRLLKNKTIADYSERDQKEVLNHVRAYDLIAKWAKEGTNLTEELVKDLHEVLVKDIFQGGVYRNVNIQIKGASHQPPDYIKVYDRMKKHYDRLDEFKGTDIEKAVYAHASIAKIHPFFDGNGRLARLILNYYLLKAGYLPISIPKSLRETYISKLEIFKAEKNLEPLTKFFEGLILARYEEVLQAIDN